MTPSEAARAIEDELYAVSGKPVLIHKDPSVEIAILGQRGLDIKDPEQKYSLRTLPGEFSGLHLCSIMYAAFKQFAPNEDVGIDFSKEYEAAIGMRPH